jgi:hypothetical protein
MITPVITNGITTAAVPPVISFPRKDILLKNCFILCINETVILASLIENISLNY